MCHKNLHTLKAKAIYNNNKKALLAEKFILGKKSTSQFYVLKCHRNVTNEGWARNVSTPNLNALGALTVHAVN